MSASLLDAMFSTPAIDAALDDGALLQAMLDVEAALAGAQAECGLLTEQAAGIIAAACRAERIDRASLAAQAAPAGNLAIPLVRQLTALVAEQDAEAARWVHWGATSQDVIDTATVLQLRVAAGLIDADLDRLLRALAQLAEAHRGTMMAGRTWLQHALPIPFGLKAANWLSAVAAARESLASSIDRARLLQFGGAAGTLASLGTRGLAVSEAMARRLDLALPPAPWHGDRTAFAAVAAALGLVCGALGKMARDVSLLMQTEIGEAAEPAAAGKGGSSTMPHKRNPVGCAIALAAAVRAPPLVSTMLAAMVGEHERSLGGWHGEWQTLPALLRLAAAGAAQMAIIAEGIELFPDRMGETLDRTGGLLMAEAVSMALAEHVGKAEAHRLVEHASRRALREHRPLQRVLLEEPEITARLPPERLAALMEPASYLGMADRFITRILAHCAPSTAKG